MEEKDLTVLKKELQKGNNDALKFIFEKYGDYCIQNLQNKVSCPLETAEDILIDAILNFRDKLLSGKITYLTSLKNYMLTTCLNMYRVKQYKNNIASNRKHEVNLFFYEDDAEGVSLPMEEGVYSEKMQLSLKAFSKLKEACQKILNYFYVSNYTMEEIAEVMGMSNANVAKTQKNRCFNYWQKIVEEMTIKNEV